MHNQQVAIAGVPVGACRTLTKLGSQPWGWTSLEYKAQPGSALSLTCLPNLGALLLLLVRNRLQGREPGPWGAGRTLPTVRARRPPSPDSSSGGPAEIRFLRPLSPQLGFLKFWKDYLLRSTRRTIMKYGCYLLSTDWAPRYFPC